MKGEPTQLALSPGGNRLSYSDWAGCLWLVSTAVGAVPRKIAKGEAPEWSPDGRYLSYLSSTSGTLQLWLFDTRTDVGRRLTNLSKGIDPDPATGFSIPSYDILRYSWSRDGSKIVFSSRVPKTGPVGRYVVSGEPHGPGAPLILNNRTPPEWTTAGVFVHETGVTQLKGYEMTVGDVTLSPPLRDQLFVVDVGTGATRQVTNDGLGYFEPAFSPTENLIAFASNEGRPVTGWTYSESNIYILDLRTGRRWALTTGPQVKSLPEWSSDGRSVAFDELAKDGSNLTGIEIISVHGGKPSDITRNLDRYVLDYNLYPSGGGVVVQYFDGMVWPIASIATETGAVSVIIGAKQEGTPWHFTVSRSGAIAWVQNEPSDPGLLYFKRSLRAPEKLIVDLYPEVHSWKLGQQQVVHWRDRSGDEKDGILLKPVGYQKGRRYPLIVSAYPEQNNNFKRSLMEGNQAWASMGYAVLFPAPRGPHVWENVWTSPAFDEEAKGRKGVGILVDDVVSGVQEVVREGVADPKRMCIVGFSNGGAVVDQAITKTHIFKCAVSVAAALGADWSTSYFMQTNGQAIAQIEGHTPFDDPEGWMKLSAVYRAKSVTTPVLLADGDNDGAFLWGSIEMYNALRYAHKSVTFLRYPDQGHGFEGEAMRDFWHREMAFFGRYLRTTQK